MQRNQRRHGLGAALGTYVGDTVNVLVTAKNVAGSASATSAPTELIKGFAPANNGIPTITGSLLKGQLLTAGTGTWTGTEPISFRYQWKLAELLTKACSNMEGRRKRRLTRPRRRRRPARRDRDGEKATGSRSATSFAHGRDRAVAERCGPGLTPGRLFCPADSSHARVAPEARALARMPGVLGARSRPAAAMQSTSTKAITAAHAATASASAIAVLQRQGGARGALGPAASRRRRSARAACERAPGGPDVAWPARRREYSNGEPARRQTGGDGFSVSPGIRRVALSALLGRAARDPWPGTEDGCTADGHDSK